jgi:hypothetical protein
VSAAARRLRFFTPFLSPATMAEPGSSKSRLLAALDFTLSDGEEDPSPSPILPLLQSQKTGEKRRRGAGYAGLLATPINKRHAPQVPRTDLTQLPSGLLANTQSPSTSLN